MKRVISLLACTTEMLFCLGREDWLVGRSHECDYPEQAHSLPVVTRANIISGTSSEIHNDLRERQANGLSLYDVDETLLSELKPDLLLTQDQCAVCAVTPQDVERAACNIVGQKTEVLAIKPFTLQDVWDEFLRVAVSVDAVERAEVLLSQWQSRLKDIPQPKNPPRVLVLEWLEPLMGCGYWTPELVGLAGGTEVLGQSGDHAQWLTLEQMVELEPDVVVLAPCGLKLGEIMEEAKRLDAFQSWSSVKAVRDNRVYAVDGNFYLSRSGPRLVESAEILGHIIRDQQSSGDGWLRLIPLEQSESEA